MSRECDILPIADSNEQTARLADLIEGVAGEWSLFDEQHGFGIDGVDLTTVALPDGWRERLVRVQSSNTAAPSGKPQYIGWCLDPHDLCAAKLVAGREKDGNFVSALLEARLIHREVLGERLTSMQLAHPDGIRRAIAWLAAAGDPRGREGG